MLQTSIWCCGRVPQSEESSKCHRWALQNVGIGGGHFEAQVGGWKSGRSNFPVDYACGKRAEKGANGDLMTFGRCNHCNCKLIARWLHDCDNTVMITALQTGCKSPSSAPLWLWTIMEQVVRTQGLPVLCTKSYCSLFSFWLIVLCKLWSYWRKP